MRTCPPLPPEILLGFEPVPALMCTDPPTAPFRVVSPAAKTTLPPSP